jgi:hypothetical protein
VSLACREGFGCLTSGLAVVKLHKIACVPVLANDSCSCLTVFTRVLLRPPVWCLVFPQCIAHWQLARSVLPFVKFSFCAVFQSTVRCENCIHHNRRAGFQRKTSCDPRIGNICMQNHWIADKITINGKIVTVVNTNCVSSTLL